MAIESRFIERLAITHPRAGIALAGWLGEWGGALFDRRLRPSVRAVRAVFGDLSDREVARIRRRVASVELRNHALNAVFMEYGLAPILPLVRVDPGPLFRLLDAKKPVVAVAWHMGPLRHLMATLGKLEIDALIAGGRERSLRAGSDRLTVVRLEDSGLGTSFLRRALETLERGGVVGMAVDGRQGGKHPVEFMGQPIGIGRGISALARRSGSEIVPVTARFLGRSSRIETRLHEPLPRPAVDPRDALRFDVELLSTIARFFEEQARRSPENVRIRRLRREWRRLQG